MKKQPPLPPLTPAQRAAWWDALKAVACADGAVSAKEKALLTAWAGRLEVELELRETKSADVRRLTRTFKKEEERVAVFNSLAEMATCDGDYRDEEDEWLNDLALSWWPPESQLLRDLDEAQARALWLGLCAIAFCDGVVSGRERHILANWRERLNVPKRLDRAPGRGLDDLVSAFDRDEERTAVCELLLALATCDGDLKPEEREVLGDLTKRWKLPLPR
ncbi:MAG: hypothetical protein AAB434_08340 [Planctomycetota bacterium]